MKFEERELKPYAEPVEVGELVPGKVYFSVTFLDEEMLIPKLEPLVFLGMNLEPGDSGKVWFQDFESHASGTKLDSSTEDEPGAFFCGDEHQTGHIFTFERALDVLMVCALKRRKLKI